MQIAIKKNKKKTRQCLPTEYCAWKIISSQNQMTKNNRQKARNSTSPFTVGSYEAPGHLFVGRCTSSIGSKISSRYNSIKKLIVGKSLGLVCPTKVSALCKSWASTLHLPQTENLGAFGNFFIFAKLLLFFCFIATSFLCFCFVSLIECVFECGFERVCVRACATVSIQFSTTML